MAIAYHMANISHAGSPGLDIQADPICMYISTPHPCQGRGRCPGLPLTCPLGAGGVAVGWGGWVELSGAGSWAGDEVLRSERSGEELCTSGFLTLAFNVPPQPDGKNK